VQGVKIRGESPASASVKPSEGMFCLLAQACASISTCINLLAASVPVFYAAFNSLTLELDIKARTFQFGVLGLSCLLSCHSGWGGSTTATRLPCAVRCLLTVSCSFMLVPLSGEAHPQPGLCQARSGGPHLFAERERADPHGPEQDAAADAAGTVLWSALTQCGVDSAWLTRSHLRCSRLVYLRALVS
jgi:hypothetical protein